MTARSEAVEAALRDLVAASEGNGVMGGYRAAWARLDAARAEARAALALPQGEGRDTLGFCAANPGAFPHAKHPSCVDWRPAPPPPQPTERSGT
jgi:hypothetical protein